MKHIAILLIFLAANISVICQEVRPLIYHAIKTQTILESTGVSKGWTDCDLYVKFYISNNKKLDSIMIDANKHLGIIITKAKATYKIENTFWDIYTGIDDITAEDLEIRWALFEKEIDKQAGLLYIKYTDFTINLKLANK